MREDTMDYNCPVCGGTASATIEEREITFGRQKVPVGDEFMRCEQCGERFYLPGQMEATDQRAGEYAKRVMRVFLPFQIADLRERLALNRVEFEHLLGTGAKTDIRWEQGKVVPNAAVNALLFLLDANPENVRLLAGWRGQPTTADVPIEPPVHRQYVVKRIRVEDIQYPDVISMQPYLDRRLETQLNVPAQSAPYTEATG